ncbi:glycosyltransferase [Pedobacter sp. HMF7056]|uniref:Glycosyltransferase n=1 Tax=Hufsiella ginkgonis TaxID=2695274 RepID=A0A7K1XZM8_9SPHI|nr:glycosyltransferase [Hufsiella ginkgonis]
MQLYFILVIHQKLRAKAPAEPLFESVLPVSVIICARNEDANLQANLPLVLEQRYDDFEVVVVNDCSSDESEMTLKAFTERYPQLRVVTIDEHKRYKHGKKFAVTLGIKAARYDHLLFTDADCKPASPNWIALMASKFRHGESIVLGYSPYMAEGGFLNRLIRFETWYTAMNYLSFSLAGNPYMGVGRNLAYTKSLFFKGKGFASHMHIQSGDDDLFVNQHANGLNTVIEISPDAHTWSEPKHSFSALMRQKIRHQGAGGAYRREHKRILAAQAASGLLFYVSLACLIVLKAQWWVLLPVYAVRLLAQLWVYLPVFKKLRYSDLAWWLPLFDLIYYFYLFALTFISLFKKKIQWK